MTMTKEELTRQLSEMLDSPYPEEHHSAAEQLVITYLTEHRCGEAMTYYQIISASHWARVKHLSILAENAMAAVRAANEAAGQAGGAHTATAIAQLTPLTMALKKLLDS